ncbi:hypothetical protein GEV33_005344 [Tenebrio molitor]|uniref:Uncharacterized protein n=1 Tax=Tenebrio molitor TaxID=7067 RepID=A0A8J6LEY7_TENMO|nr:hypothetical protein GEV33_005344 [Tenebrio molitor]
MISADDPDALGTRRDTTTLITPGAASQRDPDVSPQNGPPANNDTELAPRLYKIDLPASGMSDVKNLKAGFCNGRRINSTSPQSASRQQATAPRSATAEESTTARDRKHHRGNSPTNQQQRHASAEIPVQQPQQQSIKGPGCESIRFGSISHERARKPSSFKLPNIHLPTFNGVFTEWITFRDSCTNQ